MNKKILAVWFVLLIILFFFLKSGFTSVRVMRFSETQETTVRELTDWKVSSSGQKDENGNYISTYTIKVPLIHNSSETMMFYTTHSDVSVYVGSAVGQMEPVLCRKIIRGQAASGCLKDLVQIRGKTGTVIFAGK